MFKVLKNIYGKMSNRRVMITKNPDLIMTPLKIFNEISENSHTLIEPKNQITLSCQCAKSLQKDELFLVELHDSFYQFYRTRKPYIRKELEISVIGKFEQIDERTKKIVVTDTKNLVLFFINEKHVSVTALLSSFVQRSRPQKNVSDFESLQEERPSNMKIGMVMHSLFKKIIEKPKLSYTPEEVEQMCLDEFRAAENGRTSKEEVDYWCKKIQYILEFKKTYLNDSRVKTNKEIIGPENDKIILLDIIDFEHSFKNEKYLIKGRIDLLLSALYFPSVEDPDTNRKVIIVVEFKSGSLYNQRDEVQAIIYNMVFNENLDCPYSFLFYLTEQSNMRLKLVKKDFLKFSKVIQERNELCYFSFRKKFPPNDVQNRPEGVYIVSQTILDYLLTR